MTIQEKQGLYEKWIESDEVMFEFVDMSLPQVDYLIEWLEADTNSHTQFIQWKMGRKFSQPIGIWDWFTDMPVYEGMFYKWVREEYLDEFKAYVNDRVEMVEKGAEE